MPNVIYLIMNYYDATLKSVPKATFKLNSAGTAYEDLTGNGYSLTGTTFKFVSPIMNGNSKALAVNSDNYSQVTTNVFIRGNEYIPFSLETWVLPTTFTGAVSILSHTNAYDGLTFDGDRIKFKVAFVSSAVEVSWPTPDFVEAYHVVATYSPQKIQLYVNRQLVSESEISSDQLVSGFVQESSSILYSGQSVSGNERLVVDGISLYNKVLSRDEIAFHFLSGRHVPTVNAITGVYAGSYWDGTKRDVALQRTWDSTEEWATGTLIDCSNTSGSLVPLTDPTTDLSLPGSWNGSMGIGSIPLTNIYGIKALWNGDGLFTVEASLDGITYSTLTNGSLIPNTLNVDPTGKTLDLRVTFVGGVLNDSAQVRDLTITAYETNKVYGTDISTEFVLTGAVSTALESNEPIERNSKAGMSYEGGYGLLKVNRIKTNLSTNPSLETNLTNWLLNAAGGSVATSRPTSGGIQGTSFYRLTWSTNGTSAAGGAYYGSTSSAVLPILAGEPISASCWVRTSIAQDITPRFYWYNSSNTNIMTSFGTKVSLTANVWTRVSVVGLTAPSNTAFGLFAVYGDSTTGTIWQAGNTQDVDGLLIEKSLTLNDYYDGSTIGCSWAGTPHASISYGHGPSVTNLATNPGFYTSITGSQGYGGPTRTRDTTFFETGIASLKTVNNLAAEGPAYTGFSYKASQTYTAAVRVFASNADVQCYAGGTDVETTTTNVYDGSAEWQTMVCTFTIIASPTQSVGGFPGLQIIVRDPLSVAGDIIWIDRITITQGVEVYDFDGNSTSAAWTGTANDSTSIDKTYDIKKPAALEFWVKPDSVASLSYIFDARDNYYNGYIYNDATGLNYVGSSAVYINGVLSASATKFLTVGEWTHILYVATASYNSDITIGARYTPQSFFDGQIGMVTVYPATFTSTQALALYNSYSGIPTDRCIDANGIGIAELSNAYTNYALSWAVTGAGG